MLYNPPTGGAPNDPYLGKTSSTNGSKLPPAAAEFPQREIVNAIVGAGLTPTNSDLTQLKQAIGVLAAKAVPVRKQLSLATSYYVNPVTGSDTAGDGLTTGTAWATLNKAYSWLQANIDANGQTITINCGFSSSTVYAPFAPSGGVTGIFTPSQLQIIGDTSSRNCSISTAVASGACVQASSGAQFTIKGFTLASTGTLGSGIFASSGAKVLYDAITFGQCNGYAQQAAGSGTYLAIVTGGSVSFTGNSQAAVRSTQLAECHLDNCTITTGAIICSAAFVSIADGALLTVNGTTFTGSTVNAQKFMVTMNGMLDCGGSQSSTSTAYLPGSNPGSVATGGQYQ